MLEKRRKMYINFFMWLFFSFQFESLRIQSNFWEPYVTITCPRRCSPSYILDYRKYCTCPILYFILSPEYVRHLPHFNGNFYSGHLASKYVPTDPTMTDPTVTPSLRTPCKVSLLGMAHRVPYVLFIIEILLLQVLNCIFFLKILILTHLFLKNRCCCQGCSIFWDICKIEMKSLCHPNKCLIKYITHTFLCT